MPITFEEAAVAFAKQMLRAEQAEARIAELEKKVKELEQPSGSDK